LSTWHCNFSLSYKYRGLLFNSMADIKIPRIKVFKNPDKEAGGSAGSKKQHPGIPKRPFRWQVTGKPNSGKRGVVLNVIHALDPPPKKILVIHLDKDTKEYKVLKKLAPVEMFGPEEIPDFGDIDPEDNAVLIVDEVPSRSLTPKAQTDLGRLLNYGSSHRNITVFFVYQNETGILPAYRRAMGIYTIFPNTDGNVLRTAAHRAGLPTEDLGDLMSLLRGPHDNLTIDTTVSPDSPWRYRLNIWSPIETLPTEKKT
jgi:hypothetical protein